MNPSDAARELVLLLADRRQRIVLAESCTGGMVSSELAKIAGVSQWFCGSAVTYRCDTKSKWLGVNEADIERYTAVSRQVAEQMASGVLSRTPEADVAASITGHLGPQSPPGFDGLIFIGTASRTTDGAATNADRFQLSAPDRLGRQQEATILVLAALSHLITGPAPRAPSG